MSRRTRDKLIAFDLVSVRYGSYSNILPLELRLAAVLDINNVASVIYCQTMEYPIDLSSVPIIQVGSRFMRDPAGAFAIIDDYVRNGPYFQDHYEYHKTSYEASIVLRTFIERLSFKQFTDTVTRGYKKLSASGSIIMNAASSYEYDVQCPVYKNEVPFSCTVNYSHTTSSTTGTSFFYNYVSEASSTGIGLTASHMESIVSSHLAHPLMDGTLAINAAYDAAYSADVDVATMLAERRETISALATMGARIHSLYSAIRHGNFRSISPRAWANWVSGRPSWQSLPPAEVVASAWLEARYAWRPLVYDCKAIAKKLSSSNSFSPRKTYRGFKVLQTEPTILSDSMSLSYMGEPAVTATFDVNTQCIDTAKAGLLTEVSLGESVMKSYGLTSPLQTIWELTPYSFVVDWFVNIRSLVNQLGTLVHHKSLGSWCTYRKSLRTLGTVTVSTSGGPTTSIPLDVRVTRMDRTVGVAPRFSLKLDFNLNVEKLVDAVALLLRLR